MKVIVFTGGPCGGKTSIIEMIKRDLGPRIAVVPEAATILYGGGFPRLGTPLARRCVQRAVFHLQHSLEDMIRSTPKAQAMLCDRGTLDGPAYFPTGGTPFLKDVETTFKKEAARYDLVFHIETPRRAGYQLAGTRNESQADALKIDARIERSWHGHPRRFIIEDEADFMHKARKVRSILERELPDVFSGEAPMKPLILIAEDEKAIRTLLERQLIHDGFDVVAESDGIQATLKAKEIRPDAIILDVQLPGAYGFSVFASLQQDTDTAGIPVLFISGALPEADFHKRIPESAKTHFLAKPFEPPEAVAAIKKLLGK